MVLYSRLEVSCIPKTIRNHAHMENLIKHYFRKPQGLLKTGIFEYVQVALENQGTSQYAIPFDFSLAKNCRTKRTITQILINTAKFVPEKRRIDSLLKTRNVLVGRSKDDSVEKHRFVDTS